MQLGGFRIVQISLMVSSQTGVLSYILDKLIIRYLEKLQWAENVSYA